MEAKTAGSRKDGTECFVHLPPPPPHARWPISPGDLKCTTDFVVGARNDPPPQRGSMPCHGHEKIWKHLAQSQRRLDRLILHKTNVFKIRRIAAFVQRCGSTLFGSESAGSIILDYGSGTQINYGPGRIRILPGHFCGHCNKFGVKKVLVPVVNHSGTGFDNGSRRPINYGSYDFCTAFYTICYWRVNFL